MEQNKPIVSSFNDAENSAKSQNKILKVLVAVLAVVAVCGLGFGIFGMSQSQSKEKQISELKVQVEDANGTVTELETDKIETTQGDKTVTITDSSEVIIGGPYIREGYFYVPDWGWKVRIPDDLTSLGFAVDYDEAHVGYDLPFIGFTAVLKSDIMQDAQVQYYDNILTCSMIEVNRTEKGHNNYTVMGDSKEIGNYILRISDYSVSRFCEFNRNADQVYDKLRTMFQNPEEI